MTDMERWKGRVAMVTGASSGIGRAIARRLADAGMRVAVCARREQRLREIAEAGGEVLPVPVDLRDPASIAAAFDRVRGEWGGVDVMVNNAGLGHREPLTSGDHEKWREMLDVNVLALCICTREAVADMRSRGDDGHVIHVSSMAGHRVPRSSGVYSATKFAVRSLTEGLRAELRELESDIRVSAISPGFVETEFHEHYLGSREAARQTYSRFPVLKPEDIAATVEHVLSLPAHVQVHDVLVRPTRQPT